MFGGVSEDEVEHYSEVFADTGTTVQVSQDTSVKFSSFFVAPFVQISLGLYYMFGLGGTDRNLVVSNT